MNSVGVLVGRIAQCIAFLLLTQRPRVRFSASRFIDGALLGECTVQSLIVVDWTHLVLAQWQSKYYKIVWESRLLRLSYRFWFPHFVAESFWHLYKLLFWKSFLKIRSQKFLLFWLSSERKSFGFFRRRWKIDRNFVEILKASKSWIPVACLLKLRFIKVS